MSPELINNIATMAGVIVAALGAFIFALWIAMGIWAFNDIRSRTRDWLAILLAVLLVLVFPIIGLILYTLIRPKATLADVYDRALEEEALLRELEETHACPTCGVPVRDNWVYCPNCHAQLQHTCPTCNNMVRNEWAICVYCGTPQRAGAAIPAPRIVQPELTGVPQQSLGSSAPALPAGATVAASNQVRRAPRNPFSQQVPATPPPSSSSMSTSSSAGNSSGMSSSVPAVTPLTDSSVNPAAYAPPAYPSPAPYSAPTTAPDMDLDDGLYRPSSRPSEGS